MTPPVGAPRDLRAILDALPERVVVFRRADLVVVYCNAAKAAAYGLTPDALVGRSLEEVLPADEAAALRAHTRALDVTRPLLQRSASGDGHIIEWIDQLIEGEDGFDVLSVGRDVTEHRRIADERREISARFEVAMGEAPIGMALVDLEGRILEVNQALCAMLGRDEEELLALSTFDVTHPDDVELDREYGRLLIAGQEVRPSIEKRFLRPDGAIVWGLLNASVVHDADGEPAYLVGQVLDITERIAREVDLERLAADEHAVADRLRELDEMKDSFITAVSHEMRTPLTSLQGFAELLRHRRHDLDDATVDELIDRLHRNAHRLGQMLGDLLELEPLVSGRAFTPRLAASDLAGVVARAVEYAPLHGRRILTDLEPVVLPLDTGKVERIVASLLSNAVRHTPDGTTIWVTVRPDDDGGLLTIADDGPGIPDSLKNEIFDAFVKGPTPAARVGGSGIGLALVARFADLHGGRAWLDDRDGGGTAVQVWFPAQHD